MRVLSLIWALMVLSSIFLIKNVEPHSSEQGEGALDDGYLSHNDNQHLNPTTTGSTSDSETASSKQGRERIRKYDPSTGEIIREYQLKSVSAAFYSVRFYQYFALLYLANIFVSLFSYLYKPIGLKNQFPDSLLSWAGSFSAIT